MSGSRLFKILYYLLRKERATAHELAAVFEVSTRTIYRDIEALSSAGIPIYTEAGRNGGISLMNHFVVDKALLSQEEKETLLAALKSLTVADNPSVTAVLEKLSGLFKLDAADYLEVDLTRWGSHTKDASMFEQLKAAVIKHRVMKITYVNSSGEKTERSVLPLKLSYKAKEWYLKAFCRKKQDFRLFKLTRILHVEILEEQFIPMEYPEPVDLPPGACPEILLRFPKEAAYRVYDEFDESQIEDQENGDFLVRAQMPVDAWLVGYLLSFGSLAEVVEPISLRDALAKEAQILYEKYK